MKIKSLRNMLNLKAIAIAELVVSGIFFANSMNSDFAAQLWGNLAVSLGFLITGLRSLHYAHLDYRELHGHLGENRHGS